MPVGLTIKREVISQAGFFLLGVTLFMISNQRMISLYSLAGFLMAGLVIWIIDFKDTLRYFKSKWYLIAPPLIYFLLYQISLILQRGNVILLERYLMFLAIPILGFPLFSSKYIQRRIPNLFKLYVAGLVLVSFYLIIRVIIVFFMTLPENEPVLDYFVKNNPKFVSWGFSVLEHPSYLSMKLVFAFIILYNFSEEWKIGSIFKWTVFVLFTATIFMLASKAGIIAWIVSGFVLLLINVRRSTMKPVAYVIIFSFLIGLTIFSVNKFERIRFFIVYTGRGLAQKDFDWKNLDQRTRNWYAATTLIRDHPITGNGFVKTEDRMVEVYQQEGFTEEAELRMNAHNQFLEAQMTFGIAGTFSLFWMLLTPLIFRRKLSLKKLVVPFFLIFVFFILFESMLNRQWGIMFFLLFYFIILLGISPDSDQ